MKQDVYFDGNVLVVVGARKIAHHIQIRKPGRRVNCTLPASLDRIA
jgi:hypothetical protein